MNATETKLYNRIRKYLPGKTERVENIAGTGIPDVHGTEIIDYWIELKICRNKLKRCDILDLLEPSQKIWHKEHGEKGAVIMTLTEYPLRNEMILQQFIYDKDLWPAHMELCYQGKYVFKKEGDSYDWSLFNAVIMSIINWRIKNGICSTRAV